MNINESEPGKKLGIVPVSVIVPCFLCIDTIARAIASIEKQDSLPQEVILIDDASPDGGLTVKHLYLLREKYQGRLNIKVIGLEYNSGAGAARNAGWEQATQPFIAFLDADDSWHHEKLSAQYKYMRDNPNVIVSGHQCLVVNKTNEKLECVERKLIISAISPASFIFKNAFSTPTVMLKRDIGFRFPAGKRYAEDMHLWQLIAFAGMRIVRIEAPLAFVHKDFYGAGGLSENLWKMEQGELENISNLRQAGYIGRLQFCAATAFSLAKFLKRFVVTKLRLAGGLARPQ
jgi:glycosyltransferase involved in cell wall biosynthesis